MKINSKLSLGALSLVAALPNLSHAAGCGVSSGVISPCGTAGLDHVGSIITKITNWVLAFGGSIAILFIIYGGIQYITAAGNEKQAESAKQTLTYAVIGLIVILLSTVIVALVANTLNGVSTS